MDNIIKFISNSLIKDNKYPVISVILFIVALTLNIIQYIKNDNNYLQSLVKNKYGNIKFENILLYLYDIIGINGFIQHSPAHILLLLLTYGCLSLIEMNIGHIYVVFFLLILLKYQYSIGYFKSVECADKLYNENYARTQDIIQNTPYCCGSFITWACIGFCLYIIQNNIKEIKLQIICWIIIGLVFSGLVIVDKYMTYIELPDSVKTCQIFFWHPTNFLIGILIGAVLSYAQKNSVTAFIMW